MDIDSRLITKYNKATPRYTSYPTVPHWQDSTPTQNQWLSAMKKSYNDEPGISLYIHLPFCEALCTYCGCNKRITKNHGVEEPYIDAVLNEWAIYRNQFDEKPIIKEIHLGGGTPTFFAPKHLERLLTNIIGDCVVAENHEFSFEAHPNSTTYGHLKALYQIGFRRISIGVQDVSPKILKAINRQQTSEEVRGLTRWSRAIGYTSVNYDIIYGLPFQQPMDIMYTAEFIGQNRPDRIAFYSYAHVPWKSASQRAFTIDDVLCLPDEGLNKAYKAGKMHRNFMGYTANYTKCSIALGASSISDSWDMYVQNEKHVETYQEIVNQGKLPVIKGHKLSDTEMLMRKHILNLMCKDYTSWDLISKDAIAITPFLNNLNELAEDGLVTYDQSSIYVTEMGKYFIRNICAAIDPIFQTSKSENPMFSKAI